VDSRGKGESTQSRTVRLGQLDPERWLSSWMIRSLPQWSRHKMKSGLDVQRSACDGPPVSGLDEDVQSVAQKKTVLRSAESSVLDVYFQVLLAD
jgi:hypothetical protein